MALLRRVAAAVPISFAPSQAWQGNDGLWPTFVTRVGTPEQVFDVLISTVSQETRLLANDGCLARSSPANCGLSQGVQPFRNEASPGFQPNVVRLIFGVTSKDPPPWNLWPQPKANKLHGPQEPSTELLVVSAESEPLAKSGLGVHSWTFSISTDESRPLAVALQPIQVTASFQGVAEPLKTGIIASLNSTVANIWLPESACEIFEQVFLLVYDNQTNRYLMPGNIRTNLTMLNPDIVSKVGGSVDSVDGVDIALPYKAFDLVACTPIYPNATKYFPLRHAANETQYTLGRTFFQESYVIADYERSTISVSQCGFEENNPQNIVTIYALHSSISGHKPSINALYGIIIGATLLAICISTSVFLELRVRRKRQIARGVAKTKAETDNSQSALEHPQGSRMFEVSDNGLLELSPVTVNQS
ncbi:hypothetical protein BDZ45DRAFT_807231 [Acephala macrosclerotiorum]|nr:hypothetical protein BDZ45DRAFT_807231 [Acephala macrosclerotiorum]